jgi:hypothetical protein
MKLQYWVPALTLTLALASQPVLAQGHGSGSHGGGGGHGGGGSHGGGGYHGGGSAVPRHSGSGYVPGGGMAQQRHPRAGTGTGYRYGYGYGYGNHGGHGHYYGGGYYPYYGYRSYYPYYAYPYYSYWPGISLSFGWGYGSGSPYYYGGYTAAPAYSAGAYASNDAVRSDDGGGEPPPPRYAEHSSEERSYDDHSGRVRLEVRPDDASVYVDDQFHGTAREARIMKLRAGPHVIELIRPGFAVERREVTVVGGESRDVLVELLRASR